MENENEEFEKKVKDYEKKAQGFLSELFSDFLILKAKTAIEDAKENLENMKKYIDEAAKDEKQFVVLSFDKEEAVKLEEEDKLEILDEVFTKQVITLNGFGFDACSYTFEEAGIIAEAISRETNGEVQLYAENKRIYYNYCIKKLSDKLVQLGEIIEKVQEIKVDK